MIRTVAIAIVAASACASTSTNAPKGDNAHLVVVDEHNATTWTAPATYTVRKVNAGNAERVVGLPGVGEIHVGYGGDDDACRLVWSKAGLDRLVLFTATSCAARERDQICFRAASFTRPNDVDALDPNAPRSLVVDGCADENELMWSKLDGPQQATVGPSLFRQRCAPVPKKRGCDLVYLHKLKAQVATNDAADQGFAFAYDGDRWRACFLEKESGPYEVDLDVEDTCNTQSRAVVIKGNSADLE